MGFTTSHALELAASAAGGASIVLLLLWREGWRKQRVREGIRRGFKEQGREAGAGEDTYMGSRKPPSGDLLRGKDGGQGRGVESQGELAAGRDLTHEDGGEKQASSSWRREEEDKYTAGNGVEVNAFEIKMILSSDNKPVTEWWRKKYESDAHRMWDRFYHNNENNFFKDRHYLHREWQDLLHGGIKLLDAGCGVGNSAIPLLKLNPDLRIWACDFSPNAVDIMQKEEGYDASRCSSWVADLTKDPIAEHTGGAQMDIAVLIFVLSAISPSMFVDTLRNVASALRAGGEVLFRDYGLHDMAQLKMAGPRKNKISDNFYVRGDGTRAYFFSEEELEGLFREAGFETVTVEMHKRVVSNRKDGTNMHRRWVQGRFRKLA